MFKDTEAELQRLEAELLAQEEPEQQKENFCDEEYDSDEPTMIFRESDDDLIDEIRQVLNGYDTPSQRPVKAYNADRTEEDLEEYSRQVWEDDRKKDRTGAWLVAVAVILTISIVALVGYWMVRYLQIL